MIHVLAKRLLTFNICIDYLDYLSLPSEKRFLIHSIQVVNAFVLFGIEPVPLFCMALR